MKMYVVRTHLKCLTTAILLSTNIYVFVEK